MYVSGVKIYQFKANNSETKPYPLCLGNISKDFTVNKIIKNRLNGYVYNYSVDYNTIEVGNIVDIPNI